MCSILMAIKPMFVDKIISGEKKFEFRKKLAKKEVDKIVIYSTSPVMRVIAEVEVIGTLSKEPNVLWEKTNQYSGIEKKFFLEYFANKKCAYAYELGSVFVYDTPKTLKDCGFNFAPQSFVYIRE